MTYLDARLQCGMCGFVYTRDERAAEHLRLRHPAQHAIAESLRDRAGNALPNYADPSFTPAINHRRPVNEILRSALQRIYEGTASDGTSLTADQCRMLQMEIDHWRKVEELTTRLVNDTQKP